MKRGGPMKRSPMKRGKPMKRGTVRLRSRRKGHGGAVAGRSSATPAQWQEMSEAVRERHGRRCSVPWCRRSGALDIQHIVKRSQGGADDPGNPMAGEPGNLLPLCRPCHDLADNAPAGPTKLYLAPVSSDPPLACGFYVRQGERSGFISLLAEGSAIHETF
jgi:hypothetical protein